MKEHGLLFTAPMVRALLTGTKTQTRRLVKEPKCARVHGRRSLPHDSFFVDDGFTGGKEPYLHWKYTGGDHGDDVLHSRVYAPHGPVGRRLWVRETWAVRDERGQVVPRGTKHIDPNCGDEVVYRADDRHLLDSWRTPLHMPRWASRITLEVTRVRLERVQAITEEDARAEGVEEHKVTGSAADRYSQLWDEINGAGSWAANPWVWVYDFRRVTP